MIQRSSLKSLQLQVDELRRDIERLRSALDRNSSRQPSPVARLLSRIPRIHIQWPSHQEDRS